MKKILKEMIDKYDLTEYKLTKNTGACSRSGSLEKILSGEREITSVNLNLISAFARGVGLRVEDLLDDFDLDGTTSQVLSIERMVNRFRKVKAQVDIEYPNGGFIKGANIRKNLGKIPLKKKHEFLKTNLKHGEQSTNEIYLLNNAWLNSDAEKYNRNATIANISHHYNAHVWVYFIYSPLKDGGDFKVVAGVYDKHDNFMFTDIYGCEWIDIENNRDICYYNYRDTENEMSSELINDSKKKEVSELEFFQGFYSQSTKFGITP